MSKSAQKHFYLQNYLCSTIDEITIKSERSKSAAKAVIAGMC